MRYLISFLLLFVIFENVLSDDSLKKRIIRTLLKIKEIKQRHDMQRKLQSTDQTTDSEAPYVEPTVPEVAYNDTGKDNPEDSNPLGNDTTVEPDKPFSTPEATGNKAANIQPIKYHSYHWERPKGQETHYKIEFKVYIYIFNIPIPKLVIYRLRIKQNKKLRNLQEEEDESVKSECTIADEDKNLVGQIPKDGSTPNYNCEAKTQNSPENAQVAINTDVDMVYSKPDGSLEQLSFGDINFVGNSSEEATNLQQSTEEVPKFTMLKNGQIDDADKHTLRIIGDGEQNPKIFDIGESIIMSLENLNRQGNDTIEPYECIINNTSPFTLNCDTSKHSIKTSPHALHLSSGTKEESNGKQRLLQILMQDANSTDEFSFYSSSNNRYKKTSSGLSGGAIAGIVIACVVVLVAASIAAIMLRKPSAPIDNSTAVGLKSTDNL